MVFYRAANGVEPVRAWLKTLGRPDSVVIGHDLKTVQLGWPIGMPVCRPLGKGLYEVRSSLSGNRIARVLFCFYAGDMVLLHGFIKKTRATPERNIALAQERRQRLEEYGKKE